MGQVGAQTGGRWDVLRLLVWAGLLIAAFAARTFPLPAWRGVIGLWGWPVLVVGLGAFWAVAGIRAHREWKHHSDRLHSIPIRIHVDGSRGKTGTCRLIGAALRANGVRVVVKTTGKIPALIDASGTETILERPPTAGANLREQKDIIRLAAEQHAQAVVIECMAVDPELRRVSQSTLLEATVAVVTNVRRDHLEVIGPDLGTAARNLAEVIPRDGTLVTAEQRLLPILEAEAERRHATVVSADPASITDSLLEAFAYITFKENIAVALKVSDLLGLDRRRSVEGMLRSAPDYGTVQLFERQGREGSYTLVCALGVNDVESLRHLHDELTRRRKLNGGPLVGLFNSRDDRATRSVEFAKAMAREMDFRSVLVTGRHANAFVRAAVKNGLARNRILPMEHASPKAILETLDAITPAGGAAFACGNMVTEAGYGIVEELKGEDPNGRDTRNQ